MLGLSAGVCACLFDLDGVVTPTAAVFEDTLAGGFGYVVGVDRAGEAAELRAHGAYTVVKDLADLLTRSDPGATP